MLPPGQARFHLRDATSARHDAVDAAFSIFDLNERHSYRAFLEAQYACIDPLESSLTDSGLEAVLPDWPSRRRGSLLAADLADLAGDAPSGESRPAPAFSEPVFSGLGGMLGAAYVLEGSRFGGAALARRLPPGVPQRFLGAAAHPATWRALVATLDHHLASPAEMDAAVAAARAVFATFEAAARRNLEPVIG